MTDVQQKTLLRSLGGVTGGFARGLAQAVGAGVAHRSYPAIRSSSEAIRGDWAKLGGDMRNAVRSVGRRG